MKATDAGVHSGKQTNKLTNQFPKPVRDIAEDKKITE